MTLSRLLSHIDPADRQTAEHIIGTNWPGATWFSIGHLRWLKWFLERYK